MDGLLDDPKNLPPAISGLPFERIIFFSDAVFAIAITLLALGIRLPDIPASELNGKLPALVPMLLSYLISFLWIGMYWVLHHRLFQLIKRFDSTLIWLNLAFLLFVALMPFPSSLLGRFPAQRSAVVIYALAAAAIGFMVFLIWQYASHHHRLIEEDLDEVYIKYVRLGLLNAPAIFLFSIILSFIHPVVAIISWQVIWWTSYIIGRAYSREMESCS